jgi:hypothetical protein
MALHSPKALAETGRVCALQRKSGRLKHIRSPAIRSLESALRTTYPEKWARCAHFAQKGETVSLQPRLGGGESVIRSRHKTYIQGHTKHELHSKHPKVRGTSR